MTIDNLIARIKRVEFLAARAFKSIQRESETTYEELQRELVDLYKQLEIFKELEKKVEILKAELREPEC